MADYTLNYWPIPFRGHFLRFALAQAGATWNEATIDPTKAAYPVFAQPLLIDHATGRHLSQAPAIAMYLGRKHALIADPDETLRLICDAMDVLYEITRYHGAQMWDRAAWAAFTGDRLPRWMQVHERVALAHGVTSDTGFLFAPETPSLADLTLAALWHTMVDKLPGLRPLLHETAPTVLGLCERVVARDAIARVLADWPEPLYCGGQIEASIREMLAEGS